jgi:hypothetical protein
MRAPWSTRDPAVDRAAAARPRRSTERAEVNRRNWTHGATIASGAERVGLDASPGEMNMPALLITYDIGNDDRRKALLEWIKLNTSGVKLSESSYVINVSSTVSEVYAIVVQIVGDAGTYHVLSLRGHHQSTTTTEIEAWLHSVIVWE